MNFGEFRRSVRQEFVPQEVLEAIGEEMTAPPATDAEIAQTEAELGAELPEDYVAFLKTFGGGTLGFNGRWEDVFSVRADHWSYIVSQQPPRDLVQNFVGVVGNGCGDLYGFAVADGVCQPRLLFADHELGFEVAPSGWPDLLSFLARTERRQI